MDVPADIRETVDAIFDNVAADESVADAVARAILAERERERTRCADQLEAAARGNFLLMPAAYRSADPQTLLMASVALREIRPKA